MKFCIGIVSYLPKDLKNRPLRIERLNRLLRQINDFWPYADILVIAQNWQDFKPVSVANKIIKYSFDDGIGILRARDTLRTEFLKLDYDYIILFDDDAIIKCEDSHAHIDFMNEVDKHKNGFCFIRGENSQYHPYIAAQLNLCAISRFIYENEPMVDVDPQKDEGFEDSIFACLLHYKWSKYEFLAPTTIRPIQFQNKNEVAPSTWFDIKNNSFRNILHLTNKIQAYIKEHHEMPKDYKLWIKDAHYKGPEKVADGKPNVYLYF